MYFIDVYQGMESKITWKLGIALRYFGKEKQQNKEEVDESMWKMLVPTESGWCVYNELQYTMLSTFEDVWKLL